MRIAQAAGQGRIQALLIGHIQIADHDERAFDLIHALQQVPQICVTPLVDEPGG